MLLKKKVVWYNTMCDINSFSGDALIDAVRKIFM